MNCRRSGLTLVEVLAATVLLAVLAVACLPVMRAIASRPMIPSSAVQPEALGEFADAVLSMPELFGVSYEALSSHERLDGLSWSVDDAQGSTPGRWPKPPAPSLRVEIDKRFPLDASLARAWLVFECHGTSIARCIAVSPSSVDSGTSSHPRGEP